MGSHLFLYETLLSNPTLINDVLDTIKSHNLERYRYKYWKNYPLGSLPKGAYFDCYCCCIENFFRDSMTLEDRDSVYSSCSLVRLPKELLFFYPREKVWDFSTEDKFIVGKKVPTSWIRIRGYEDINFFSKDYLLNFLQIEEPKAVSILSDKFIDHLHFAEIS